MKRKDKKDKSNKAKEFLSKYQLGGDYDMQDPYSYLPDLQSAQQAQLIQYNQPKSQSTFIKPQPMSEGFDAIPFISPAINLGIGIKNIIDSFGERKRQKRYERAYRKDLEKRMEEARTGDYYRTPYEFEEGGLYPEQDLDFFIDFYNQKEQQNKLQQEAFENYYTQKNEMMESNWKNKQKSGIQSALTGAFDIAKTFVGVPGLPGFQLGGIKPDTLMQRSNTNTPLSRLTADYFNLNQPANKTNEQIDAERASYIYNFKKENPEMFDLLMGLNPDRPRPSKSKRFDKWRYQKQEGGEYNPKVDLYSPEYDPNEFLGIKNEISEAQIQDKELSTIEQWLFQDEPDVFQEELNLNYFNPEPIENTNSEPLKGLRDLPIKYEGDISFMGKSIAVSHNNPGNIKMGKFAEKYGATPGKKATDGGLFARFPDVKTGLKAQRDLLKSGSYINLTVKDAMKRWSNSGYGADLFPEIADKPMYLLTESELIELQRRQIQREDPNMYKLLYLK